MQEQLINTKNNGSFAFNNRQFNAQDAAAPKHLAQDPIRSLSQLEMMRPTLDVFLGGTGQIIGVHLKGILQSRFGDHWRTKIRLLGF